VRLFDRLDGFDEAGEFDRLVLVEPQGRARRNAETSRPPQIKARASPRRQFSI